MIPDPSAEEVASRLREGVEHQVITSMLGVIDNNTQIMTALRDQASKLRAGMIADGWPQDYANHVAVTVLMRNLTRIFPDPEKEES